MGAPGIWVKLRGCSNTYAVLHIAKIFKLIDNDGFNELLGELGEFPRNLDEHARRSHTPAADPLGDPEEYLKSCVEAGHLVLRDDGERMLHWHGKRLEIKLLKSERFWEFFIKLAQKSKSGMGVGYMDFPGKKRGTFAEPCREFAVRWGSPTTSLNYLSLGTGTK